MENILSRLPNFSALFGQIVMLVAAKNEEKRLLGLILQANGLMENFLRDDIILAEIDTLPKDKAEIALEILTAYQSLVKGITDALPSVKTEKIQQESLKESIKDFFALFQLVLSKVNYIVRELESICEDATHFIEKHPHYYQKLIKLKENFTKAKSFEVSEFENFIKTSQPA
jgi:hypothetical protein